MAKERKAYAPFSLTSEAGVAQTPVDGYIDVRQEIYPTVNTGTINENGKWAGVKSDDTEFIGFTKVEALGSSSEALVPTGPREEDNYINMAGFRHLQIAIKSDTTDTVDLIARMGPDTSAFANLSPVSAGAELRFLSASRYLDNTFDEVLKDTSEVTSAGEWVIWTILDRMIGQEHMQIGVNNDASSPITFEFAYRRLV